MEQDVAQFGRVAGLEPDSRWFESIYPDKQWTYSLTVERLFYTQLTAVRFCLCPHRGNILMVKSQVVSQSI